MADNFQYYFDEKFFESNTVKRYDLFDSAYKNSYLSYSDGYMESLKLEENFLKMEESYKDSFEHPFKSYNYYSGNELPYMPDYLF